MAKDKIIDEMFDAVLDIRDDDFSEKFMDALGLKPGDSVEIITPVFDRTDGKEIAYTPTTIEEFNKLRLMSEQKLIDLGLGMFDVYGTKVLWLYPHEWYDNIPDGYPIVSIAFTDNVDELPRENFKHGETDNDKRYGLLSFGFIRDNSLN